MTITDHNRSTNFKVSTEAPDICILNYGSWNQDPGDNYNFWEGSKSFKAQLRERKDMDKNKGTKFVWKLLNPPHFQCKEAYEPLPTDPNDDPFDLRARVGTLILTLTLTLNLTLHLPLTLTC